MAIAEILSRTAAELALFAGLGFLLFAMMSAARSIASGSGCTARGVNSVEDGWYGSSSSNSFCWMSIGALSMIGRDSSFAR